MKVILKLDRESVTVPEGKTDAQIWLEWIGQVAVATQKEGMRFHDHCRLYSIKQKIRKSMNDEIILSVAELEFLDDAFHRAEIPPQYNELVIQFYSALHMQIEI